MTTVSPAYILGSWELRKTFSKTFLLLTVPKSTYGLSVHLFQLSFTYVFHGPKNYQFDSFMIYQIYTQFLLQNSNSY